MFNRIRQWWNGKSDPGPETSGGWDLLEGLWTKASQVFGNQRSAVQLEETYGAQSTVYACVKKICLALQEAPLKIGKDTVNGWVDLEEHPLQQLLEQPNGWMSQAEFLWHAAAHLELTGYCYIWKWRNAGQYVNELWPVPTSWVRVIVNDGGTLVGYEVWQGGSKAWKFVLPGDMIRIIYPDPTNLTRGLGPLQAAMREVQTDSERQDYFVEMLVNSRTPGLILKQPEGWTVEQKDEARALLSDGLGRGRRGKSIFLEGEGATIEQMIPLKDLDWPGLTNLSETRICSAFEVPPILIGLRSGLETATYSNFKTAERAFYRGAMAPKWMMIGGALTKGLIHDELDLDTDLEVYHDLTDIRGMREDEDKTAERAVRLFAGGLATRNEAREKAGLQPLSKEQGDVFLLPMSSIEVPLAPDQKKIEAPPKDTGTGDDDEEDPEAMAVAG